MDVLGRGGNGEERSRVARDHGTVEELHEAVCPAHGSYEGSMGAQSLGQPCPLRSIAFVALGTG